jgi:hypothetical protein
MAPSLHCSVLLVVSKIASRFITHTGNSRPKLPQPPNSYSPKNPHFPIPSHAFAKHSHGVALKKKTEHTQTGISKRKKNKKIPANPTTKKEKDSQ